jgi:hypothetical protein
MAEDVKKSFEVNILGQKMRIRHEDDDYVQRLEAFLNKRIEDAQSQQNFSTLQLAARVLLVLADECITQTKAREADQRRVEDRARRMIEIINRKTVLD